MKLTERDEISGVVELGGVQRSVSLMLLPDAAIGDHVLVHAGYAIATVDAAEAAETLRLYEQMRAAESEGSP